MEIGILIILLMLIGGLWACRLERHQWNNGTCRDNGLPWKRFDTSSQGCRGYTAGDKYLWISWPVDTPTIAGRNER